MVPAVADVGDDEPGVPLASGQLGLAHDPALPAPALPRAVAQLGEGPRAALHLRRPVGPGGLGAEREFLVESRRRLPEERGQHALQAAVAHKPENIPHVGLPLDPGHGLLAA